MTDDFRFEKNYGVDDLETFGLKDIEARKGYFRHKAARLQKEAEEYLNKAKSLDDYTREALKTMTKLGQQGKKRLDGKIAEAIARRKLNKECGLVKARTRLHCTNDTVELLEVYWADGWLVETVDAMKSANVAPSLRSKFYTTLEEHRGDVEGMKAEAGLVLLGNI